MFTAKYKYTKLQSHLHSFAKKIQSIYNTVFLYKALYINAFKCFIVYIFTLQYCVFLIAKMCKIILQKTNNRHFVIFEFKYHAINMRDNSDIGMYHAYLLRIYDSSTKLWSFKNNFYIKK